MMTADTFVELLRLEAPAKLEALRCRGSSSVVIDKLLPTYQLQKRMRPRDVPRGLGEVGLLIRRYDVSQFLLCSLKLADDVVRDKQGNFIIGMEEADPLILDPSTGEIRVHQLGTNGYVLHWCAASPERFLEALVFVARFYARPDADRDRPGERRATINRAAEAAGGETYLPFYDYLMGGYDDPDPARPRPAARRKP